MSKARTVTKYRSHGTRDIKETCCHNSCFILQLSFIAVFPLCCLQFWYSSMPKGCPWLVLLGTSKREREEAGINSVITGGSVITAPTESANSLLSGGSSLQGNSKMLHPQVNLS